MTAPSRLSLLPAILATTIALASTPSAAQLPAEITPGARVRVALPESMRLGGVGPRIQYLIGTVARVGADTVHLAVPGVASEVAVGRPSLDIGISRGVSRTRTALHYGLLAGVVGAMVLYNSHGDGDADGGLTGSGSAASEAMMGGAVGFGLGGLFGAMNPAERWRRVRLDR